MSETIVPVEQPVEPAALEENKTDIDKEAVLKKSRELLAETKKAKLENLELKKRLDAIEQDKLESQGKYSDINKSLKARIEQYENSLSANNKKFRDRVLNDVISKKAVDLGCEYPELILKLMDPSEKELVDVDDNFNVNESSAESVLSGLKNKYPNMFKQKIVNTKDVTPNPASFVPPTPGADKAIRDMTDKELDDYYKKISKRE